jgi:hypothetical protein
MKVGTNDFLEVLNVYEFCKIGAMKAIEYHEN